MCNEQQITRGEVWYYKPQQTVNQKYMQGGERPVIIVSNDACNKYSPVILAAPCTSQPKKNLPTHVLFTIDGVYNTALVEQSGPILVSELVNKKYVLDDYLMNQVDEALAIAYGLKPAPGKAVQSEVSRNCTCKS